MKLVYCLEYCKSDLNFQKSKRYSHLEIHAHSQIIMIKPPQQEHWKIKTFFWTLNFTSWLDNSVHFLKYS